MSPNSNEGMPQTHHEAHILSTYSPPGMQPHPIPVEWVRNMDGTPLLDHNGRPVSVNQILATKPLKPELCSRPGPGGKKLTYLSGEGVTRTLNEIFGYDGWNLDIKETKREECVKDDKDRFHVAYTSRVRLTHRKSGAYKEDCGAGDSVDRSMGTAVAHAMKASVTDAMKRAARHFGDKLGNSLYGSGFNISKAPGTLQQALEIYELERAKSKFGPLHNQLGDESDAMILPPGNVTSSANAMQKQKNANKHEQREKNRVSYDGNQEFGIFEFHCDHPQQNHQVPSNLKQETPNIYGTTTEAVQQSGLLSKAPMNSYSSVKAIIKTPHQNSNQSTVPMITPSNQRQDGAPPPPTPTEGLQSSNLFGLGALPSAYKQTHPPQYEEFSDLEFEFDLLARPPTSTGRKSKDMPPPPMAGKRLGIPSPGTSKRSKLNPYL